MALLGIRVADLRIVALSNPNQIDRTHTSSRDWDLSRPDGFVPLAETLQRGMALVLAKYPLQVILRGQSGLCCASGPEPAAPGDHPCPAGGRSNVKASQRRAQEDPLSEFSNIKKRVDLPKNGEVGAPFTDGVSVTY